MFSTSRDVKPFIAMETSALMAGSPLSNAAIRLLPLPLTALSVILVSTRYKALDYAYLVAE